MPADVRSPVELGARLRSVRAERGLTQAEVALAAGVSRAFVTDLERGQRPRAELSRVLAVVKALDLAVQLVPAPAQGFDDTLAQLFEPDAP